MDIQDKPKFNEMQTVKRQLYAMRNGIVADALRKGGSPFRIIFGVNLPQLVEIARNTGKNQQLAERLWENNTTRESMLIAPMLMPADEFGIDDARRWLSDVHTVEVADILCHRLLRHEPYALLLAKELLVDTDEIRHYTGMRLMCNIASQYPDEAREAAAAELATGNQMTRLMAMQLADQW